MCSKKEVAAMGGLEKEIVKSIGMRPQTFFGPSECTKYYQPEELFFLWSGGKKGACLAL